MNVNSLDDNDNVNHNDNYNDLGSPLSIDDDINIINGINDVNDSIDIIDIAETQNVESDNDPLFSDLDEDHLRINTIPNEELLRYPVRSTHSSTKQHGKKRFRRRN